MTKRISTKTIMITLNETFLSQLNVMLTLIPIYNNSELRTAHGGYGEHHQRAI